MNREFWLGGTEDPLPLAVDLARGSVAIVGGNHQVGYTRGGADEVDFRQLGLRGTTPFDNRLPFKVGKSYDLRMSEFELRGSFPGVAEWTFTERPGTESTLRLENIRKDAAGKTLRGDATFRMYGLSRMKLEF